MDRQTGGMGGMSGMSGMGQTARHTASAWALVLQALGPAHRMPGKAARFARALAAFTQQRALALRLQRLQAAGIVDEVPSPVQLAVGSIDMLRFWIVPGARDYYEREGLDFWLHQLLRWLDEPASLLDPVGLYSTRDAIIGHLMQVVHSNATYDLELLEMWDDGLSSLEEQLEQMLAGTHPRSGSIGAIVEEPDYHRRLLDVVRAWRRGDRDHPLRRSNVEESPALQRLDEVFGTMRTAFRYFCRLPRSVPAGARHLATVKAFPHHLAPARADTAGTSR